MPTISPLLGAALLILQLALMLTVGLHRGKSKISLGLGDDQDLERKVRRHGNLAENSALFLAVFIAAEMAQVPRSALIYIACTFFAARVFHAFGFSSLRGSHQSETFSIFVAGRALGAFGTAGSGIVLCAAIILHVS